MVLVRLHRRRDLTGSRAPITTREQTMESSTFLVFGATGQTGQHFVSIALETRPPGQNAGPRPEQAAGLRPASGDPGRVHHRRADLSELVQGADAVIATLGDAALQGEQKLNTAFATYNYNALQDPSAVHTCDFSAYRK